MRPLRGRAVAGSPATTALKIRPTRRRPAAPSAPPHSRAIRFPQAALPAAREPSSKVRSRQPSDLGRHRRERAPRPPELLILRRALSLAKDGWQLGENLHVHPGTELAAVPIPSERRPELGPWRIPDPKQVAEKPKMEDRPRCVGRPSWARSQRCASLTFHLSHSVGRVISVFACCSDVTSLTPGTLPVLCYCPA